MNHEEEQRHTEVRVHIDRKEHRSPNPTTGDALYSLGKVHDGYGLFTEEEHGRHEDKPVPRGHEHLELKPDEHFYSEQIHDKGITIIVNARQDIVHKHHQTFEQIVALAYPTTAVAETTVFTVTYYKGVEHKPEGTLLPGQRVRVRNGEVFNVTATNRS